MSILECFISPPKPPLPVLLELPSSVLANLCLSDLDHTLVTTAKFSSLPNLLVELVCGRRTSLSLSLPCSEFLCRYMGESLSKHVLLNVSSVFKRISQRATFVLWFVSLSHCIPPPLSPFALMFAIKQDK